MENNIMALKRCLKRTEKEGIRKLHPLSSTFNK